MELARFTSRGGLSVRSIFLFSLTALITAFLLVLFGNLSQVHAADDTASWKGESIVYDGFQYFAMPEAKAGESHGLPAGTMYYQRLEQTGTRPVTQKAHVLYFTTGTDPPTATTVTYVTYDYSSKKVYSNPSTSKSLTIKPQGTSDQYETSCAVEGVGWIVCSVSIFLAGGMDWFFGLMATFIEVQPAIVGDSTSDLFIAWNIMRSIANVAFVIVFMIIIYSQLTGLGINNYGLKKLIPRLIVAAILVNLSYYICAIAIDVSNVLGYSVQDIFTQIRDNTFLVDGTWLADDLTWENVTSFVLSGGTATAAIGVTASLAILGAGTPVALIFMILPALLALLLAVLVVVVILAARQAIIVLLVIVAPLAFVAYLLPNTEKWFTKWRELFMTMLIFFPAFSLVFGGSQLAGGLIIQNATTLVVAILGMIVQVAPLVITPLLLKLSGSLLGRIGGLVNDPKKGILDRARTWSKANADYHRLRAIGDLKLNGNPRDPMKPGELRRRSVWKRSARYINSRGKLLEDRTKVAQAAVDNSYHSRPAYTRILENASLFDKQKELIETDHKDHIQRLMAQDGTGLHRQAGLIETRKANVDLSTEKLTLMNNRIRLGRYSTNDSMLNAAQTQMERILIETATLKGLNNSAQFTQQKVISDELSKRNTPYLNIDASGIGDANAIKRIKAGAMAAVDKLEEEIRKNTKILLGSRAQETGETMSALTSRIAKILNNAKGEYSDADRANLLAEFDADEIEAAFEFQLEDGQVTIADDARASRYVDQKMFDRVAARHADTMKKKGAYHIQANPSLSLQRYLEAFNSGSQKYGTTEEQVIARFKRDQNIARMESLAGTTADNLNGFKSGGYKRIADGFEDHLGSIMEAIEATRTDASLDDSERNRLITGYERTITDIHSTMQAALRDDGTFSAITDRLAETHKIDQILSERAGVPPIAYRKGEKGYVDSDDDTTTDDVPTRPDELPETTPEDTPTDPDDQTPRP